MGVYQITTTGGVYEITTEGDEQQAAQESTSPGAESQTVSFLKKADRAGAKVLGTALDVVNAPFELVGESMRVPVEEKTLGGFRAPTIAQKVFPSLKTDQPPANPFTQINKMARGAGGFVEGMVRPDISPVEGARIGYGMDRGGLGVVEDVALGALMGKVSPQAVNAPFTAIGKAGKAAIDATKRGAAAVGKKAIRVGLGPTEEAQNILIKRPQDVARQTNFEELGEKLADKTNELSKRVSELSDVAWDKLLKLKAEPQSKLISILKGVKKEFVGPGKTKVGDSDRQAAKKIDDYIKRISDIKQKGATKGTEQFLDQPQIKNIIQSIEKDARYDLPETDPVNRAVQAARAKIDSYLKGQNPDYEEAMKPVAEAVSALKYAVKKFGIERKTNEGFLPTKNTVSRLAALPRKKSPELERASQGLKKVTGVDFEDEARLTATKLMFEPGENTRGSARTLSGGLAGLALEPFIPGPPGVATLIGGAAGRTADYYGGAMAKNIIQGLQSGKSSVADLLNAAKTAPAGSPIFDVIKAVLRSKSALSPLISRGSSR